MSSGISFTCDSCGREVFSCNIVNGMKFCAKCYQETFGNQQKYFDGKVLSAYEDLNKEFECKKENVKLYKQIAELQKQLEEKERLLQYGMTEIKKLHKRINDIVKRDEKLFKSQPAEIVEKIKNYKGEYFEWTIGDKIYPAFKITEEDLDNILKEYQK